MSAKTTPLESTLLALRLVSMAPFWSHPIVFVLVTRLCTRHRFRIRAGNGRQRHIGISPGGDSSSSIAASPDSSVG